MASAATIVHDTSEAVALCPALGLYLKPITKMTISVALPPLRPPGKSISNWEVMERLKAMVQAAHAAPFSALRIAKSTLDFVRFEGEVENRALVKACLACLDGKTIKLAGFADALRVRAAEFRLDFPSRHDWDSFFRDAADMNETLPGERPDTIHLEGLPCRWFAPRNPGGAGGTGTGGPGAGANASGTGSGGGGESGDVAAAAAPPSPAAAAPSSSSSSSSSAAAGERPSEALLRQAFRTFGEIRHVDIPMLDPYREEMTGRSFHTFGFGGHLHFEAYVQYREYAGFVRAMSALRGMKLMFKGEDGKAVACNIKVTFDSTKHLSDASIRKRQLERQKLQELELQREEQKRREKEAEERLRAEERKQKELEEQERARKREEKLRRREQRQRERESRRSRRRAEKLAAEEQRRLQARIRLEERKLLLAQRTLQSIRLVAELLSRAKAARLRQRQEERRRLQEAELRRVEREKERALGLQRRERELRQRLLSLLLGRRDPGHAPRAPGHAPSDPAAAAAAAPPAAMTDDLLRPVLDILHRVTRAGRPPRGTPDAADADPEKAAAGHVLASVPDNAPAPKPAPAAVTSSSVTSSPGTRDPGGDPDKCNRDPEPAGGGDPERGRQRRKRGRGDDAEGGEGGGGFEDTGADDEDGRRRREGDREGTRQRRREKERGRERRRSRHRRSGGDRGEPSRSRSRSPRHRGGAWNR